MDLERAQQIIKAEQNIGVLLNGFPVWIEGLSGKDGTARVIPLDGVGASTEVSVEELVEK